MKRLKSIIAGFLLSILPVSAFAADSVIYQEPEAVQFVRVCDTYGSGYFYIPGTETCLGLGGDIRAQYGKLDFEDNNGNNISENATEFRARLQVLIRAETAAGSIKGKIRAVGIASNSEADGEIDQAYIDFGNFSFGFRESATQRALWQGVSNDYLTNDSRPFIYPEGTFGFHNAWYAEVTTGELDAFGGLSFTLGGQNSVLSNSTNNIDPYLIVTYADPEGNYTLGAQVLYAVSGNGIEDSIILAGSGTLVLTEKAYLSGYYQKNISEEPTAYVNGEYQYAAFLGYDYNEQLKLALGVAGNGGQFTNSEETLATIGASYQPDSQYSFYLQPQLNIGLGDTEGYSASVRALVEF